MPQSVNPGEYTVGVIGGLGPEATLDFCARVVRYTRVESEQDHLHLLIDNNPKTPNRNHAIAGSGPSPASSLADSAARLENAGADFLVMPCNTAHAFQQAITDRVNIPFVSIIEETCEQLISRYGPLKRVGLLAVDGCMQAGLYHESLRKSGFATVCLDAAGQQEFMDVIYRIKESGLAENLTAQLVGLSEKLVESGAQVIIAGCTEVPLAVSDGDLSRPLIDTTDILAAQTVRYAKKQLALPKFIGPPGTPISCAT